jgi:hypothetical protein
MFLMAPGLFVNGCPAAGVPTLVGPLVFLFDCVLLFFKPGFAYGVSGITALLALPWFVLTESSNRESIWHYLNGPDPFSEASRPVAILMIVSVALLSTTVTCSVLRMLPSFWVRKSHLSGRTWPAILVGVIVPVVWLCHSAMPWMLPGIVDRGSSADLRILHVVRRGLRFHETSIGMGTRDARFSVSQYDRRLFQFRFQGMVRGGVMPDATRQRADDLVRSPKLRDLRTAPAKALRSWNAEGWYVWTSRSPIHAFPQPSTARPLPPK